jgi:hypothetical protein
LATRTHFEVLGLESEVLGLGYGLDSQGIGLGLGIDKKVMALVLALTTTVLASRTIISCCQK